MKTAWVVPAVMVGLALGGAYALSGASGASEARSSPASEQAPAKVDAVTSVKDPLGAGLGAAGELPAGELPAGREQPHEGCFFKNGFNICNYGDADLKDMYLRYQDFLGGPLSGFDARCQTFTQGRLCFNAANPAGWKTQFANTGLEDMQAQGFTPQSGSEPHPAVRDWLISQMGAGLDITRVGGRIISEPVCDSTTGQCRQWMDKMLLRFPQNAVSGSQVQRAPLGRLSISPPTPAETRAEKAAAPESRWPWPVLLGTGALALLVVVALLSRTRGGSISGGAI